MEAKSSCQSNHNKVGLISINFVMEVYHALFLHFKLNFEITIIFLLPGEISERLKTAKQNRKMSSLFEDKQFFLFLCLRTSKILSLGEFDEVKSHLFLVHFSV